MGKFTSVDKSLLGEVLRDVSLARDRTPKETKYSNDLHDELKSWT